MTKDTGTKGRAEQHQRDPSVLDGFRPLIVDVAVPLGAYYLLKDAFGTSTFAALAWSSVVPAARTLWSLVRERRTNALAGLILAVNIVSLLAGYLSGDPRLMLAKDGAVSSTIGIGILISVRLGRPMMSTAVRPFLVKGDPAKEAAWQRLATGASARSAAFRRHERTFSAVWGLALLTECVARVVGAYTVPVDTMVWLGTVFLVAALATAFLVSGARAAEPMEKLLSAETAEPPNTPETEGNSPLAIPTHR